MSTQTSRAARLANRNSSRARGRALFGPSLAEVTAHIEQTATQYRPKSTQTEYQRYVDEYLEFTAAIYDDKREDNRTVSVERAINFLTYTAERTKRPAKRGHRFVFDADDYKQVMGSLGQGDTASTDKLKCIDSYYAALVNFADDNTRQKLQASGDIKRLMKSIAPRRKVADRNSHQEKCNPELDAFGLPVQRELLEKYYWNFDSDCNRCLRAVAGNLRNRFCLLDTFQSLVRAESLWPGKLSDHYYQEYHAAGEPDPYTMLFRTLYVGKTNGADKGKSLTARSIRHLDPRFCSHGAYALYLFARFNAIDEEFDLTNNASWYDILGVTAVGDFTNEYSNVRIISGNNYYKSIDKALKQLGLHSSHKQHFGRGGGVAPLELAEVEQAEIKLLGNWDFGVYEKHYTIRMPLKAM